MPIGNGGNGGCPGKGRGGKNGGGTPGTIPGNIPGGGIGLMTGGAPYVCGGAPYTPPVLASEAAGADEEGSEAPISALWASS